MRPFFFILGGKPMSPRKKSSAEEEDEGEAVDGAAPMHDDNICVRCDEDEGPRRGEARPDGWPG